MSFDTKTEELAAVLAQECIKSGDVYAAVRASAVCLIAMAGQICAEEGRPDLAEQFAVGLIRDTFKELRKST